MASKTRERQQKFTIGDCVETSKGEKCIIHYIGKVDGLSNIEMYGIEYIDGTIAEYDGTYKGKKYFNGKPKRCAFIKYNKIRRKTKNPQYIFQCNINSRKSKSKSLRTRSVSPALNKKRKSLPSKLNALNEMNKKQKQKKALKSMPRRSSESNKGKNKYLAHLQELNNKSSSSTTKKPKNTKSAKVKLKPFRSTATKSGSKYFTKSQKKPS